MPDRLDQFEQWLRREHGIAVQRHLHERKRQRDPSNNGSEARRLAELRDMYGTALGALRVWKRIEPATAGATQPEDRCEKS